MNFWAIRLAIKRLRQSNQSKINSDAATASMRQASQAGQKAGKDIEKGAKSGISGPAKISTQWPQRSSQR